jgi:hypothetical protein
LRVPFLWQGSRAADLDDRWSDFEQRIGDVGVFIQTSGDADGVAECVAKDLDRHPK